MRKKVFYLILITMLILGGCTDENNSTVQEPSDLSLAAGAQDQEIIERSESISDLVVDLYSIDDATTIIFNDIAIIGIKISYDQKLTDEIKNTIIEKVKEKDTSINQVKITAKSKIFKEIDNIISQLLQGKSYDSLVNEINKIENKIK